MLIESPRRWRPLALMNIHQELRLKIGRVQCNVSYQIGRNYSTQLKKAISFESKRLGFFFTQHMSYFVLKRQGC